MIVNVEGARMTEPTTLDDVVAYNPSFRLLCWEVKTPAGDTISTATKDYALKIAAREWPSLKTALPSSKGR